MDATGRTDTTLFLPPQGPCAAPQGDFGDIAKDFIYPRIHARSLPGNVMVTGLVCEPREYTKSWSTNSLGSLSRQYPSRWRR